jgi:7,8-dihydroneopterin aldolase/epimerase/oxygenase
MDWIKLTNVICYGKHGVYQSEHEQVQRFEVDINLGLKLGVAGLSDELSDTIDYVEAKKIITATVQNESFHLLERLGSEIIKRLFFAFPSINQIKIEIKKIDVFGSLNNCFPSVVLIRDKEEI